MPRPPAEYRRLLDQVPAAIYIARPGVDGAWSYVSRGIEPLLGYAPEAWTNDPTLWSRRLHPADHAWVIEYELDAKATGSDESTAIEYRMLHRDGSTVWIRDNSVLETSQDGEQRWYGVLSDVTERKALELQLERQAAGSTAVSQLSEAALARTSISQLLNDACGLVAKVLDVDLSFAAACTDPALGTVELRAEHGRERLDSALRHARLRPDSALHNTLMTGEPAQIVDWGEAMLVPSARVLEQHHLGTGLCVRIEGEERGWGILAAVAEDFRSYTAADISFMQAIANALASAIARLQTENEIEQRALHDALTRLPNRLLLLDRIEHATARARRRHTLGALLFVDIDSFKQVNDSLGHQAGDRLLVGVASRLRNVVRPSDTVARFGGDEFAVLLEDIESERVAVDTAQRIIASLAEPFDLEPSLRSTSASIGIAVIDGSGRPLDALSDADLAMYRAKESGGGRYELFHEQLRAASVARSDRERELRQALADDALELVYEPVIGLRDRSVIGFAVQPGWQHPTLGTLRPAAVVELARETETSEQLTDWLIARAAREAARWVPPTAHAGSLRLRVELGPVVVADPQLADRLAEALQGTALRPEMMLLEVSADAWSRGDPDLLATLLRLRERGFALALNGFGTGGLSLQELAALPLDRLMLGHQLVAVVGTDAQAQRAVTAAVGLARSFSLPMAAAGVETETQLAALRESGCELAQGPAVAPALTAAGLAATLAGQR